MFPVTAYGITFAEQHSGTRVLAPGPGPDRTFVSVLRGLRVSRPGGIACAALVLLLTAGGPLTTRGDSHADVRPVPPSERVCPLDVIASASPPPSYGDCLEAWMWWRRYLATMPRVPM